MVSAMTGEMYCPVYALSEYMSYRGKNPRPLFLWRWKPLSRKDFVSSLKLLLSIAGIPNERFNSHSFRIGAATSCAVKGVSDAQIRQLGHWHSDAFKRYIRSPNPLQQLHLASRWRCHPSNHNSVNCLHILFYLKFFFNQGGIIAGRLAQSIVYGQLLRGRQVVNKEADLVALLSLSSTLRGERKSLFPWKTAAVSY